MSLFNKLWKEESSENLDAFFAHLGVPAEIRQKYSGEKAKFKIEKNGDNYVSTFVVGDRELVDKFTSGVEFIETPVPNVQLKTTATVDGNVINYVQHNPQGKIVRQRKELVGDKVKVTLEIDGWEGKATIYHTAA